jgi:uncharacterized cupredoxin-like copper-binding protein
MSGMSGRYSKLANRAIVVAAALLLACGAMGCGGNGSAKTTTAPASAKTTTPQTAGKTSSLKLSADPSGSLRFNKTALQAPAGQVTIQMKNPSALMHNIAVEGNGVDKTGPTVGQGGTSTVTAELKPGKYTFYCSVDGHKAAGMMGTLSVR